MAEEVVRSRFEATTAGYDQAVQRSAKVTDQLATSADKAGRAGKKMGEDAGKGADQATTKFQRLSKAVTDHRGDMEQVGTSLLGIGAGLTAMAVGAGKAAMDWESAWAGVMKTNDGTSQQTQKLETDLRNLTSVLPATHDEIAGVAEAAGQLGVGIDDVAGFSEVMLNLGETTNLSADEAATALARFSNIMGTSFDDADKLGSTIVDLGNNFATTESEIVNMSMRVAAVGRQMGMSESDVLALSTAMSSVGVEAEAGGTAISNSMKKIDAAVREGGAELTGWAEAAGVSAEEFAAAWESDPARAMVTLTEGLGEVSASGGDVNGMLEELGITGIRESDTLLRLSSATGVLSEALDEGASAWEENIALAEEAELRYETAESKIAIAWNQIKDAAIDAGGAILPVVATVAEGAAGVAEAFSSLPDPVKNALGVLSGAGGILAIAAGGMLTLAPRVMDTVDAFRRLNRVRPGVSLGNIGKTAGTIGAVAVAMAALGTAITNLNNEVKSMEELTLLLGEAEVAGKGVGDALDGAFDLSHDIFPTVGAINNFGDALAAINPDNLGEHLKNFESTVLGLPGVTKDAYETIDTLDKSLSSMDATEAANQMNQIREEAEGLGHLDFSNWTNLTERMPEYTKGIREMAEQMGVTLTDAELFQVAMGNMEPILSKTGDSAEGAAEGVDELAASQEEAAAAAQELEEAIDAAVTAIESMGSESRTVQAANDAYQASIDGITDALEENGKTLDATTDKGRANREELRGLADAGTDSAARMAEFGVGQEEVQAQLEGTYDQLVAAGEGFGLGAAEAEAMAREILEIPPEVSVESWMSSYAAEVAALTEEQIQVIPDSVVVISEMDESAMNQAFKTAAAIDLIDGYKLVDVAVDDQGTPGQVQERVNAITGETVHMFVTEDGSTETVQQQILEINGKDVPVYVKDDGTVVVTQGQIDGIHGKDVTIWAEAATADAESKLNNAARTRWSKIIQTVSQQKSPTPYYTPFQAEGGLAGVGPFPKHADGRLPHHAMGRLPYTGLGTDRILGVNSVGTPVAMVDDGEGIIRESSTRKHLGLLGMVNDDDPRVGAVGRILGLPGYAGGSVGREWSASSMGASAMGAGPVSASVDSGVIANAVASAISSYQPVVKIGMREFIGEMKQDRAWKGAS